RCRPDGKDRAVAAGQPAVQGSGPVFDEDNAQPRLLPGMALLAGDLIVNAVGRDKRLFVPIRWPEPPAGRQLGSAGFMAAGTLFAFWVQANADFIRSGTGEDLAFSADEADRCRFA